MPTASKTEAKPKATKSPIPKRILTRIDAAFLGHVAYAAQGKTPDETSKAQKKIDRDRKDVLAYIEELIAKSSTIVSVTHTNASGKPIGV